MSTKRKNRHVQQVDVGRISTIDAVELPQQRIKTCAYVRVSSDSDEQYVSYASQLNAYSQRIKENPSLEFVGIYADEGITGTGSQARPEFQRLLTDCRKGKVQRIITKSISRFTRNIPELLSVVRELTDLGVTFYFEKENIDTAVINSEMLLIVLASVAETESVSTSQNQKQGIQHKMQAGTYIQSSLPYGYEYDAEQQPVAIPSQAVVVKEIFDLYLVGKGYRAIAKHLNRKNIPSALGGKWHFERVLYILKNPFYIGDSLWQKQYTTDTIPSKQVNNTGQLEQYLYTDHHPAIITREDFEKVQELIQTRQEKAPAKPRAPHPFSRMIYCPYCNRPLKRRAKKGGNTYWVCATRFEKAVNCRLPTIKETVLEEKLADCFEYLKEQSKVLLQPLLTDYENIAGTLTRHTEVAQIYERINALNEQAIVYAELKLGGIIPEELYQEETAKIQFLIKEQKDLKNRLAYDSKALDKVKALEHFLEFLKDYSSETSLKETLTYTEKLTLHLDETLSIHLKDLITVRW